MRLTIGSLFDGSGGFPLAGSLCGFEPVLASEVEPYPIAVTRSRIPGMIHLGDVSKLNGEVATPVDIVTFGSPCQDMSVAGLRKGIQHQENGDEETTRSGLFMEAIRIIKEMRRKTNGAYPSFVIFENVPGAFSSNRGEDFRLVLTELIRIVEPTAVMPKVPKAGWNYADSFTGDGWSLAYRVFDAQYWGVPQRRRRIYLVLDLRGERAGEILFEREGLRGYFETGRTPWQTVTGDAQDSVGADDREGESIAYGWPLGFRPENVRLYDEKATTICNGTRPGYTCGIVAFEPVAYNGENVTSPLNKTNPQPGDPCHTLSADSRNYVCVPIHDQATRFSGKHGEKSDGKGNGFGVGNPGDPMNTLTGGDRHAVAYCLGNGQANQLFSEEVVGTLNCMHDQQAIAYGVDCRNFAENPELYPTLQAKPNGGQSLNFSGAVRVQYIVRRLTPTECARLQGFPDKWGHPDVKTELTDEEYQFWKEVRNTHAEINGKTVKEYTKEQILKWYNGLHTDSAEYKMWGNGIALPCALYVMQGIEEAIRKESRYDSRNI